MLRALPRAAFSRALSCGATMSVRRQDVRTATFGVGRGIWVAPWVGPNHEIVLIAIRSDRRLCGEPHLIPAGASHVLVADELWERLDREDPVPKLQVI
jgi:hypothetical protein